MIYCVTKSTFKIGVVKMKMKVIATPKMNGFPEDMREVWVGLVLEVKTGKKSTIIRDGEKFTYCSYEVGEYCAFLCKSALRALKKKNKLAYYYWSWIRSRLKWKCFYFERDVCLIVK